MKKLLLSVVLLPAALISRSQTAATNFTAPDCTTGSHNLFTELDNGKVVVLVWVMPCGLCVSDAKAAYDAVQGFATSNPGKVLYWLSDDDGVTSCSSIASWASTNGITSPVILNNAGSVVDQSNYGGFGMPHVVVMGGTNHKIYYNQLNGSNDGAAITTAINQALTGAPTSVNQATTPNRLNLYPNPARNQATVDYTLNASSTVSIEILNLAGELIRKTDLGQQAAGNHSINIAFEQSLPGGMYIIKLNAGAQHESMKFSITE